MYFHATLALSQNCHAGRWTAGREGCRDSGHPSPLHPIHMTWALQAQCMMFLIKDSPFSVTHLHHRVGAYFRKQHKKQDMHRMLLPPHSLQKALALRTTELEVAS